FLPENKGSGALSPLYTYQWKTLLENPGVHHLIDGNCTCGFLHCLTNAFPQVGSFSVSIGVPLHVDPAAVPEYFFSNIKLQNSQDGTGLFISEDVEHCSCIFRSLNGKFDAAAGMQAIDAHGTGFGYVESFPEFPGGHESVDCKRCHESCEGFIQPESIP